MPLTRRRWLAPAAGATGTRRPDAGPPHPAPEEPGAAARTGGPPRPGAAARTGGPARSAGALIDDELDRDMSAWGRGRSAVMLVLVTGFMLSPAIGLLARTGLTGRAVFLFPATLVFLAIFAWGVLSAGAFRHLGVRWRTTQFSLIGIAPLGGALFAVGGMNWLTALALVASAFGSRALRPRLAGTGIACCALLGLVIGLWRQFPFPGPLVAAAVALLAGLLSYSAAQRNALVHKLHETRAELARMAVAQERLRISRDLHDLLGHSLSLIALKAELAGRMIGRDPARSAKEITEIETVARRSLTEVRQAVAGYRQPGLAAELAAARRMLASAGIGCQVQAPDTYALPPEVDALLAWTVREGATNVVRHSGAMHTQITVEVTDHSAGAGLSDDGAGTGGPGDASCAATSGSGLAGLAERAASLGGTLMAGAGESGGFRLWVNVPLVPAPAHAGEPAPPVGTRHPERVP